MSDTADATVSACTCWRMQPGGCETRYAYRCKQVMYIHMYVRMRTWHPWRPMGARRLLWSTCWVHPEAVGSRPENSLPWTTQGTHGHGLGDKGTARCPWTSRGHTRSCEHPCTCNHMPGIKSSHRSWQAVMGHRRQEAMPAVPYTSPLLPQCGVLSLTAASAGSSS